MPELSERDLSHVDAYRAACRRTAARRRRSLLHTSPPRPLVGEATAVRRGSARPQPLTPHSMHLSAFSEDHQMRRYGLRPSGAERMIWTGSPDVEGAGQRRNGDVRATATPC